MLRPSRNNYPDNSNNYLTVLHQAISTAHLFNLTSYTPVCPTKQNKKENTFPQKQPNFPASQWLPSLSPTAPPPSSLDAQATTRMATTRMTRSASADPATTRTVTTRTTRRTLADQATTREAEAMTTMSNRTFVAPRLPNSPIFGKTSAIFGSSQIPIQTRHLPPCTTTTIHLSFVALDRRWEQYNFLFSDIVR
jgi:hypothetical protein